MGPAPSPLPPLAWIKGAQRSRVTFLGRRITDRERKPGQSRAETERGRDNLSKVLLPGLPHLLKQGDELRAKVEPECLNERLTGMTRRVHAEFRREAINL